MYTLANVGTVMELLGKPTAVVSTACGTLFSPCNDRETAIMACLDLSDPGMMMREEKFKVLCPQWHEAFEEFEVDQLIKATFNIDLSDRP